MTDRTHPDSGRITTSGDVLTELHDRIAELEQEVAHTDGLLGKANALASIRAHHIAELEAQLEAIGAGGVSGPLMDQPQAMPDLSQLTERGAQAWAGVDAQELREGFSAADMATASAQGFRDGVASVAANAGSEPVAWRYVDARGHFRYAGYKPSRDMAAEYPLLKPIRLYTHPSPPEGMVGGWIDLPGTLPEPGTPVLLDIGKKYPIRAMWVQKFTLLVGLEDDSGFGEYDERTDEWYCPEGWYEWNEHEEAHWAVSETPRAWMPLPPTSAEGVEHG